MGTKSTINSSQLTINSSKKATSMAELMKKAALNTVKTVHKGDVVSGIITKLTPSEILVDIGTKTEAVVMEKDKKNLRNILAVLAVGDKISVSVLNPESDMGHTVVSLRRFMDDLLWKKLENEQKNSTPINGTIAEVTRGGYLVDTAIGLSGFLPNSQIYLPSTDQSTDIVGKKITVYVLEVNRLAHKIIFSQKPVVSEEEFIKLTKVFKVGQKVEAAITTITSFGMFVSIPLGIGEGKGEVDGLIHISEISWEKVEDIGSIFTVGQTIDVVVIGIDRQAKRLDLSIRRLTADPFEELAKKYAVDQKVSGTVSEVGSAGITIDLGENATGFIRKEKIPPNVSYKAGDSITATISQFDKKRHRIELVPVLKEKPIGYR